MSKVIKITCDGSGTMPLEKFKEFQGNLKTLSKAKLDAGVNSIIKYGFSVPVAIWKDHDDILDGHQRIFIVRHLVEQEGYTLKEEIPYTNIHAKSRHEAAQKVLAVFNSRYGQITDDGLYEFINENDIDIQSMMDDGLDIDGLDMADFVDGWVKDNQGPDILDSDGNLSGSQYGLTGSKTTVPFNVLGVGGLVDREVMEQFKQRLIEDGAIEGEDNGIIIKSVLSEVCR